MMAMNFYESRGLVLRRRTESLSVLTDILGLGKCDWYDFDIELFDLLKTESTAKVILDGEIIKESSTHSDFYGVGTSWLGDVANLSKHYWEKFEKAGATVRIVTKLIRTPSVFGGERRRFYRHSVRSAPVPYGWRHQNSESTLRNADVYQPRELVIWENGHFTAERNELEMMLSYWRKEDMAGAERYMPSPPSIFRFDRPTSTGAPET